MGRRALVIMGDPEMGNAMANSLVKPLEADELATVKAELERMRVEKSEELMAVREELDRLRGAEAENGVRKVRDAKYFARRIRKANRNYRVRQMNKVEEVVLIAYALAALTVREGFRRLAVWNRAA